MSVCKRIWTEDGVEMVQEVWENQTAVRRSNLHMGGSHEKIWSDMPAGRAMFSDRLGLIPLNHPVKIPIDEGWVCEAQFKVDLSGAESGKCDDEGWSYQTSFAALENDLARGTCKGEDRLRSSVRRRRWVRTLLMERGEMGRIADPTFHPLIEGWLAVKTMSKNRIGRSTWKNQYCMLWPGFDSIVTHAFFDETQNSSWEHNVFSNSDGLADKPTIEIPEKQTKQRKKSLIRTGSDFPVKNRDNSESKHQSRNKNLLSGSFTGRRSIGRRHKDRLEGEEHGPARAPMIVFWREDQILHDKMDLKQLASELTEVARCEMSGKSSKQLNYRLSFLVSEKIVDDTIASAKEPGCFALNFPRKALYILNAFSGTARLEWVDRLRSAISSGHPLLTQTSSDGSSLGMTKEEFLALSPRTQLLAAAKSLSTSSLLIAHPPQGLNADTAFSRSQPDVLHASHSPSEAAQNDLLLLSPSSQEKTSENPDGAQPPPLRSPLSKSSLLRRRSSSSKGLGPFRSSSGDDIMSQNVSPVEKPATGDSGTGKSGGSNQHGIFSLGKKLKSSFKHSRHGSMSAFLGGHMPSGGYHRMRMSSLGDSGDSPVMGQQREDFQYCERSGVFKSTSSHDEMEQEEARTSSGSHRRIRSSIAGYYYGTTDPESNIDDVGSESSSCVSGSPTIMKSKASGLSVNVPPLDDCSSVISALEPTASSVELLFQKLDDGIGLIFEGDESGRVLIAEIADGDHGPLFGRHIGDGKELEEMDDEVGPWPGDLLLSLNNMPVDSAEEANRIIDGVPSGTSILVKLAQDHNQDLRLLQGGHRPYFRESVNVSVDDKHGEVFELFDEEIPNVFNSSKHERGISYLMIQQHICNLLNIPVTVCDSMAWRCWFRDELDEFFEFNTAKYQIVGVDMQNLSPIVEQVYDC